MDVKTLYLQIEGFTRDICVHQTQEEKDNNGSWKLLVADNGFTESGRLWYLTSYEALTQNFELNRSRYDPALY